MHQDVDRYLQDVELIKGILRQREERILLRPWAFYAWAMVTVAATWISIYAWHAVGWSGSSIAWRIWLPALFVGGGLESLGWLQFLRREEPVVLTSEHVKLLLSFCGVVLAMAIAGFTLAGRSSADPGVLLMLFAVCFFTLSVFTFNGLFLESYLLLAVGMVLIVLEAGWLWPGWSGVSPVLGYAVAGNAAAIIFAAAGVHTAVVLRRNSAAADEVGNPGQRESQKAGLRDG
ncbi:hypothetical protein [Spirochaeta africana]|uniref:Uncharacterized protein n=1 Tax=Spirochaeta africana (strain ATCC 700263 / DSM 8902 / Z-7692) TaxID=889378 RepID=H9UFJ8_SPIAZ|nr:hypothetical protein [Spirochaeta africana]AFG36291.1 hypothetical protein Spiaf_0182 [Spirochaeta africana DSM 8902]